MRLPPDIVKACIGFAPQAAVTGTVLPEIRKTRSFGVAPVDPLNLLQDPTILRQLLGDFA